MVRAGDVIENPFTGERVVFLKTGAETHGELLQMDLFAAPGGRAAVEHMHPHQAERFVVKSGELTLRVAGREQRLTLGADVTVPPRTPHVWRNNGTEEAHVVVELRPAGRFDRYVTSIFALAQTGRMSAKGAVSPIRYAVIDREYRDALTLVSPPRAVQTMVFALLYPIGKLLGYTADYPYPADSERTQA